MAVAVVVAVAVAATVTATMAVAAGVSGSQLQSHQHTPSIAFRHLPPNSARFGYATEGALFISAQVLTDAVSALRKVWVLL